MMTLVGPRFPAVPREPFWSNDETALPAIEAWRAAFATWLESGAISESLATVLLELLGMEPTSTFARSPYHLVRYPAASPSLHAVLLWRAGIVDFLSDIWDTMGAADFDIEECQLVSDLLTPLGPLCPLCLGEQGDRHFDACQVQLAWRQNA
jgi:hypothetical protein